MASSVEQRQETIVMFFAGRWEQVCRKFEELAQEFSEEDFEWRPQADMRSCGEVVRHVAFWNRYVGERLRGGQSDPSLNELPAGDYPTKRKMMQALRESAESVRAALHDCGNGRELETAELVAPFLEHTSEHYGQLAGYARLRGITPPASRG
jgi:uncharacterized damage-inducible protein DinB